MGHSPASGWATDEQWIAKEGQAATPSATGVGSAGWHDYCSTDEYAPARGASWTTRARRRDMVKDYRDDGSGFTTGVLMGAMVGAALALLFAPKAGADLRGDLGESVSSVRDAVSRRYRELAQRAGIELENLEEQVENAAESFEANAREMLDNAQRRRTGRSRRAGGSSAEPDVEV
jgi:gas vesicle protein